MTTDYRPQVQQLQRQEGNKYCIDCNAPNPQWASVSFGTFFCLECSGQHRSLGVHISFVRSVQMDSWREEQYRKMEKGGNQRAAEFFKRYGISGMPIKQKYHTRAAELYREQLTAECEGRSFEMPPPATELSKPVTPVSSGSVNNISGGTTALSSHGGGDGVSSSGIAATDKARNEDYFTRKGMENDSRPENLPPSQGGKFTGFGSNYVPPARQQEPDLIGETWSSITKGFSMFSSKAVEVAKLAASQAENLSKELNENVIKPTAQRIQDPNFRQNLTTGLQQLGKQVVETGDKGFHYIADALVGNEHAEKQREFSTEQPIPSADSETPTAAAPPRSNATNADGGSSSKKDDWSNVKDDEWASF